MLKPWPINAHCHPVLRTPRATCDEDKPALIPFILRPMSGNGAAVLVIPGGGFTITR
ncbi:MAG: hypothetical protein IPI77_18455 [Saprospiraceae bacterium]|nr:hypothetical protein [Saprospiraceae bacterium]